MVAGRPWYAAYPADFFMATQHFDLETKGAYRLLIDLLNDRDRPFPDDPKFIAGVLGCSIQKWKKLRTQLLREGKLVPTPDGLHLTNPRFDREHYEREEKRRAAVEHGRAGGKISAAIRAGQTELPMDEAQPPSVRPRARAHGRTDKSQQTSKKVPTKIEQSSNFVASRSELPKEKTPDINGEPQPPPQAPCAREESESESESPQSQPASRARAREDAPGRLANTDLKTLYDEVCSAAGVCFTQPTAIDRAMTQVQKWQQSGIDFEEVILPTIRSTVLQSDEPTRTLGRFNARIGHEHARREAAALKSTSYIPPAVPKLNPEGEDPSFLPLRTDLLEKLGGRAYCLALNDARFEDPGPVGDGRPLRIRHRVASFEDDLKRGRWSKHILDAARPYGFTDLW